MPKGYIYKISHQRVSTGINDYPEKCYIGQTTLTVNERFKQHKREALNFRTDAASRDNGRNAKLYEAMVVLGIGDFIIDTLEEIFDENEGSFQSSLDLAERRSIKHYNSIEIGWNKVLPSGQKRARGQEVSIKKIAIDNDIPYTTLLNRLKTSNSSIEDTISSIKAKRQTKPLYYEYGRKIYKDLKSLRQDFRVNNTNIDRKTIEVRIRMFKSKFTHKISKDNEVYNILHLDESIFATTKNHAEIRLKLPTGLIAKGSIQKLHGAMRVEYPQIVPKNYTTVQSRLSKKNVAWTVEEAFGFEVPPNYRLIKKLIEDSAYVWKPQKPTDNIGTPIVSHILKEVYTSQKEFSNEFKIPNDMVSDYISKGFNGDDLLKKFDII
jgi:hypothetical protein